jgi:hypothetical protein
LEAPGVEAGEEAVTEEAWQDSPYPSLHEDAELSLAGGGATIVEDSPTRIAVLLCSLGGVTLVVLIVGGKEAELFANGGCDEKWTVGVWTGGEEAAGLDCGLQASPSQGAETVEDKGAAEDLTGGEVVAGLETAGFEDGGA